MSGTAFIEAPMSPIDGGEFYMGSADSGANEMPVHRVWVDAFSIARYPVSRREYALFIAASSTAVSESMKRWQASRFRVRQRSLVHPVLRSSVS